MAQVYLSQYAKRAGIADSASHVIGGNTPAPTDTYIQYNKKDKFGAEVYFRYIYPIHSFQHGYNTNALGYWSHAEGSTTYTGFNNTFSSSILSGAVTLSAEYGNVTSSFTIGDYIYLNDYESDNIFSTAVAKITNTSWNNTSSYVTLDIDNIHATTSFVGSLGTYYIQNPLGNKTARAYIAHSEGEGTYAMGVGAHSEGSGSYAIGKHSHTEGNNTVALGNYQTVVGQYNLFSTSQSAFIIGDGYAKIIDSGTFSSSPISGSFSFNINSTYSPLSDLTGSIITIVSASSSVSEAFIINDATDIGGGEYEIIINRGITQDYYEGEDTFSILKITRHNLLFASQSYFEVSASNIFLQGIPSSSTAPQVLIYDDVTGQVYYTSSAAFGGIGSSPGGPNTSIQYNNNGNFGGAESFTLTSLHGGATSTVRLTGSMLVSGSITSTGITPNNVGFIGTASWAQSASNALQAVSASYAPNFANTNLTFTGNRDHHTNGYSYFIYSNLNGMAVSGGYQYFDNDSNSIGVAKGSTNTYTYIEIFTSSIDLSFNANPAVPSAYIFTNTLAYFSSSLNVTKSVFFPGLTSTLQTNVVTIDPATGQLYYTSSNALSAVTIPLDIEDDGTLVKSNPTFINFTGSGVSASANDTGVDVYIPIFPPFPFTGSAEITGSVTLTGSMFVSGAISASYGENTVGFYGTASWAQSASQAISSSNALSASYAFSASYALSAGTASFASTSSAAPSDTYIQYNKSGILGAEEYFRYIYTSHSLQNGYNTIALGNWSHTEGKGTIASGSYSTVVGQYNIALPSQSAFIIGDGTETLTAVGSGELTNSPKIGDTVFTLKQISGTGPSVGSIITVVGGSGSETFTITSVKNTGGGGYDITVTPGAGQNFSSGNSYTIYSLVANRHNLLFASRSWFDVSASNVFLRGIPTSPETQVLVYNTSSGQVYYTASSAIGGGGSTSTGTFSLPVPKVILYNSSSVPFQLYVEIQSYNSASGGAGATNAKLYNSPRVVTMDITDEMLANHRIFVELVHFKRGRRKGGQSYFIPPSHINSGGGVYINKLAADLGVPLSSRGGKQKWRTNPNVVPAVFADIQVNRPNHYEVTARNQTIPVYEYLNGWFIKGPIYYANTSGGVSTFDSWYPSYRSTVGNSPTGRFAYGATFSPMYVAFRYIAWNSSANGGSGAFISGPLSPIVAIGPQIFPFVQDPISTANLGAPTAYLSQAYIDDPGLYNNNLKCWFMNRLP